MATSNAALTIGTVLGRSAAYLADKGSSTARLDAELLLAHALHLSRIELYTHHDRPLTETELAVCRRLVRRRAEREPVAYITGSWGFRHLELQIDRRVLVPRPETEALVDRCLALLEGLDTPTVLDVGTGSGAIALAIAQEHSGSMVCGCDLSAGALALAAANAERLGLTLELVQSDLLGAFGGRRFDLIVSNPPYLTERELAGLEPEVSRHEPRVALLAGVDGRELYRRLLPGAHGHLEAGGRLALECSPGQALWLRNELAALGYGEVLVDRDPSGTERVVSGRWR